MDPFRDSSIQAAFVADFSEHFPLSAQDVSRLKTIADPRERAWVMRSFRALFERFHSGRESPDMLGLRPFTPPF